MAAYPAGSSDPHMFIWVYEEERIEFYNSLGPEEDLRERVREETMEVEREK